MARRLTRIGALILAASVTLALSMAAAADPPSATIGGGPLTAVEPKTQFK